jgi:hypothetical protein
MKAEQFRQILRQMIREEARKIVVEEVNKSMAHVLAEVLNSRRTPAATKNVVTDSAVEEPLQRKHYTKDERLNEVLNSTVSDLRSRDRVAGIADPSVSLSDMFEKIDSNEEAVTPTESEIKYDTSTKIGMLKSIVSQEPVMQQRSVLDTPNPVLQSVFKKDFRTLMKKIDEKQKKGGGGGFFAGAIPMAPQIGGYE